MLTKLVVLEAPACDSAFYFEGYGVCRPGIQMFDPSWREPRARGPEDTGTLDAGGDPIGVLDRQVNLGVLFRTNPEIAMLNLVNLGCDESGSLFIGTNACSAIAYVITADLGAYVCNKYGPIIDSVRVESAQMLATGRVSRVKVLPV